MELRSDLIMCYIVEGTGQATAEDMIMTDLLACLHPLGGAGSTIVVLPVNVLGFRVDRLTIPDTGNQTH